MAGGISGRSVGRIIAAATANIAVISCLGLAHRELPYVKSLASDRNVAVSGLSAFGKDDTLSAVGPSSLALLAHETQKWASLFRKRTAPVPDIKTFGAGQIGRAHV